MRSRPFTQEVQECSSLREVSQLNDEITKLLTQLLKVDKRSLKKQDDKLIYKGRVELYSKLYKLSRDKFIELRITLNDFSNYHKEPLSLEDFLDKFNYNKSIKFDDDDDEDDFDIEIRLTEKEKQKKSKDNYTTLHNIEQDFLNILNQLMSDQKKIFRRDDPSVIQEALTNSLKGFLSRFDNETTATVLEKVYHSIRSQKAKPTNGDPIMNRVGNDPGNMPLEVRSPVGAEDIDTDFIPIVGEEIWDEENNVVSEVLSNTQSTVVPHTNTCVEIPEPPYQTPSVSEDTDFDKLTKDQQDYAIMQIYKANPEFKGAAIKKQLIAQGFIGLTYDNVYFSLERVKKALK